MQTIEFDSGIREYRIGGGGVLRFNPQDPNLYARFSEAGQKITQVEKELTKKAKTMDQQESGLAAVKLLKDADQKMKEILSWVFGDGNDFDRILGGVNLLAVGKNGQRVVTNLFNALQPILVQGAEACAKAQVENAVARAQERRTGQ